jgi:apolipoprotein D and lipocalin family protein
MQTRRAERNITLHMKAGIRATSMFIGLLLSGCASRAPLETVGAVDLGRYAGRWYEIAKYPNWFQRGCHSDTMAEYALRPDGSVSVVNSCRTASGKVREAAGTATVVPGSNNAKLRVRFAGSPFAGDYWIIGLDDKNYSWSLVGHPSRKFLWILAREPRLDPAVYKGIVDIAAAKGFPSGRLEPSLQTGVSAAP